MKASELRLTHLNGPSWILSAHIFIARKCCLNSSVRERVLTTEMRPQKCTYDMYYWVITYKFLHGTHTGLEKSTLNAQQFRSIVKFGDSFKLNVTDTGTALVNRELKGISISLGNCQSYHAGCCIVCDSHANIYRTFMHESWARNKRNFRNYAANEIDSPVFFVRIFSEIYSCNTLE